MNPAETIVKRLDERFRRSYERRHHRRPRGNLFYKLKGHYIETWDVDTYNRVRCVALTFEGQLDWVPEELFGLTVLGVDEFEEGAPDHPYPYSTRYYLYPRKVDVMYTPRYREMK